MTVLQIIWPSGRLLVPPRPREMFATIDRSFAGAPGSRHGSRRFSSKIQRCRDMANGRHGQQQSPPEVAGSTLAVRGFGWRRRM